MADKETTVADTTQQDLDKSTEETTTKNESQATQVTSLEEALKEIGRLTGINKDVISTRDRALKRAQELEKTSSDKLARAENLLAITKVEKVNAVVKKALADAGAIDADIALKLFDTSKLTVNDDFTLDTEQVKTMVADLQKTATIVFKPVTTTTTVARPIEGTQSGDLLKEALAKAKTQKEIAEAYKKYKK